MEKLIKHFTASGFVIKDSKVLLLKHKKYGVWLYPGGHIEENETPDEAAIREVKEETGLDVQIISNRDLSLQDEGVVGVLHNPIMVLEEKIEENETFHFHIDFVYVLKPISNALNTNSLKKNKEMGWFSLKEIEKLEMFDDFKKQIRKVLEEYKDL